MSEQKIIHTVTEIRKSVSGSPNTEIFTYYTENLFLILYCFIAELAASNLGVSYIEGELVFVVNQSTDLNLSINSMGELIIVSPDSQDFSIDEDGNLIGQTEI